MSRRRHCRMARRAPRAGGHAGTSARGFSLLELMIAAAISALVAAAIAATVPSLQAFFERTPAAIDVQQRGRTALDAIAQAVRGAVEVRLLDGDPGAGDFRQLMTISPRPSAARGVVEQHLEDSGGSVVLAAAGCPAIADVCGFVRGSVAAIAGGGGLELLTVGAAYAASRSISPKTRLGAAYGAGAAVVEVDAYTFRLDPQADGSQALVRETAAGAVQPIVDRVTALRFARTFDARGVDVSITLQLHGSRVETTRRLATLARNLP